MPSVFTHFILYHYTSVGLTGCISIVFCSFENVDSFDHYPAFWFTLSDVINVHKKLSLIL